MAREQGTARPTVVAAAARPAAPDVVGRRRRPAALAGLRHWARHPVSFALLHPRDARGLVLRSLAGLGARRRLAARPYRVPGAAEGAGGILVAARRHARRPRPHHHGARPLFPPPLQARTR